MLSACIPHTHPLTLIRIVELLNRHADFNRLWEVEQAPGVFVSVTTIDKKSTMNVNSANARIYFSNQCHQVNIGKNWGSRILTPSIK